MAIHPFELATIDLFHVGLANKTASTALSVCETEKTWTNFMTLSVLLVFYTLSAV